MSTKVMQPKLTININARWDWPSPPTNPEELKRRDTVDRILNMAVDSQKDYIREIIALECIKLYADYETI
jgi:hypothetical protein